MKFGICTTTDDCDAPGVDGFDYIELSGRELCALDEDAFDQLCGRIQRGGVPCLRLNTYCPPEIVIAGEGFSVERAAAYAHHCARRAGALGVRSVGIGSPRSRTLPDGFSRRQALQQAVEFFRVTAREFESFGIVVCIEPLAHCYCNFINRVSEALQLLRDSEAPNLRLLLDFYNLEREGEDDINLTRLLPDLAHVHVSDDDGSPYQRSYLSHQRAQEHLRRVERLYHAGYDGTISLEIDVPYDSIRARASLTILKTIQEENHYVKSTEKDRRISSDHGRGTYTDDVAVSAENAG